MSTPDSGPPPPYSAVNTTDTSSSSPPYNPASADLHSKGYAGDPAAAGCNPSPGYAPAPGYASAPYAQPPYYGQPGMVPAPAPVMPGANAPHEQQTIIMSQPYVAPSVVVMSFGESPVQAACPFCQAQILTTVEYEAGLLTWLVCVMLAVFGCWIFCCLIPFCVDACKDVVHTCPNCRRRISVYRRNPLGARMLATFRYRLPSRDRAIRNFSGSERSSIDFVYDLQSSAFVTSTATVLKSSTVVLLCIMHFVTR